MTTPNLGLTELANGQANYLNANQAFAVIDAILQTRAISKTLTAAPGSPTDGDVYIMQSAWSGITTLSGSACADGDIAFYRSSIGAFKAIRPKEGWRIEVAADDTMYRFSGSAWAAEASGGVALPVVRAISANETLGLANINTFGFNSTASNYTSTIPAQGTVAWTADAEMSFKASSTGTITITAAAGVTLNGVTAGSLTLYAGAAGSIKRKAADVWEAVGQFGTTAQQQAALGLNGASLEWTTYGGTANAITLTPLVARSAYVAGDKVRFRATATNTGATTINLSGLGVKTCVTVTGAALPAGYIRTGIDTEAVYDGTNFVVRRAMENGSNANGSYTRWEDGTQVCTMSMSVSADITLAFLGGFRSSGFSWVYPAGFVAAPVTTGTSDALTGFGVGYGTKTTTSVFLFWFAVTSQAAATREASLKATGRWYA